MASLAFLLHPTRTLSLLPTHAARRTATSMSDAASALLWGGDDIATLPELLEAQRVLAGTYASTVVRTPLVKLTEPLPVCGVGLAASAEVHLKLESLQTTGSFKVRGMQYKLHTSDLDSLRTNGVVTMSAGNAGKAVAYLARENGFSAKIVMPESAPDDRKELLESLGATVDKCPTPELLDRVCESITNDGTVFVHPFDDVDIIRGHGSCGLEILEDLPDVDIVVVCCGGGGLLAGIAAAVKLGAAATNASNASNGNAANAGSAGSAVAGGDGEGTGEGKAGEHTNARAPPLPRVIGVEPEGANSMWLSVQDGSEHQWCKDGGKTDTVAHGLAPPFAGRACFRHVREFADGVVLVSDDDIRAATRHLFEAGIVAEVSGAAAVAAVMTGKCGSAEELAGKKICCLVSGRNIGFDEYSSAIKDLSVPMGEP